jgi:CTP:molybdopterin cytidylyltransferase MocA
MGTIPAILLAAGLSSRMGRFKPLMSLGTRTLIEHVLASMRGSGVISQFIVVLGHRGAELRAALTGLPDIRFVENPRFAEGEMLSSVQAGVAALPPEAAAFVLAFADQPAVASATIAALVQQFRRSPVPLVLPTYQGKRGHPLLISAALSAEILLTSDPDTLKTVVYRHLEKATMVEVADPSILEDLDTPEDFARAQARLPPHS